MVQSTVRAAWMDGVVPRLLKYSRLLDTVLVLSPGSAVDEVGSSIGVGEKLHRLDAATGSSSSFDFWCVQCIWGSIRSTHSYHWMLIVRSSTRHLQAQR